MASVTQGHIGDSVMEKDPKCTGFSVHSVLHMHSPIDDACVAILWDVALRLICSEHCKEPWAKRKHHREHPRFLKAVAEIKQLNVLDMESYSYEWFLDRLTENVEAYFEALNMRGGMVPELYAGIGLVGKLVKESDGNFVFQVTELFKDSTALGKGLTLGSKIVSINHITINDMVMIANTHKHHPELTVLEHLRGVVGQVITLGVLQSQPADIRYIDVIRVAFSGQGKCRGNFSAICRAHIKQERARVDSVAAHTHSHSHTDHNEENGVPISAVSEFGEQHNTQHHHYMEALVAMARGAYERASSLVGTPYISHRPEQLPVKRVHDLDNHMEFIARMMGNNRTIFSSSHRKDQDNDRIHKDV